MQSRPWSKYSKGSSAYTRLHPEDKSSRRQKDKAVSDDEDLSDDAKKELAENKKKKGEHDTLSSSIAQELQEFLNVMKSRTTKKTWKNDEATAPLDSDSDSDSDDYQDIPELPSANPSTDYQSLLRGTEENSDSDSDSDSDEEDIKHHKTTALSKADPQAEVDSGDEDVIEEGRLFIRNLPYTCTEEEIAAHVRQFGEVVDVFIPLNAKRESKGYCFVTFMFPEQAITAIEVRSVG